MGNVGFTSSNFSSFNWLPRHRHSGDDPPSQRRRGQDSLVGGVDWGASKAMSVLTVLAGSGSRYIAEEGS